MWAHIPTPDIEQNMLPAAIHGVDMCDLHQSIAPRPLLTLVEHPSPHFEETAAHIRRRYEQLGVPDRFNMIAADDPHAWTVKLRLASTDWLSRWFYSRPGPAQEPDFQAEKQETLYCTTNGSLRYSKLGESIFTMMAKKAADPPVIRAQDVPDTIRRLLKIKPSSEPLGVKQVAVTPRKGYRIEKVEFVSEPGIYIPVWVFIPERKAGDKRPLLFLNESGKEADGMELGLYERLTLAGHIVASADVRGIGETKPQHQGVTFGPQAYRFLFDAESGVNLMSWYMDESLFGMRVYDVLRCVDYMLSRPDIDAKRLRLIGQGAAALWAMHAAAIDQRITSLVAERALVSYRSLVQGDRYVHNNGVFIRDVLKHYDLPHVAGSIAPRELILLSPVDPMKRVVNRSAGKPEEVYAN
jgi:hypothetical protein